MGLVSCIESGRDVIDMAVPMIKGASTLSIVPTCASKMHLVEILVRNENVCVEN